MVSAFAGTVVWLIRIFSTLPAGIGPPTRRRRGMRPFRLLLALNWGRIKIAIEIRF
jgi:hypothetical protein